jgi:hypothetical protein
MTHFYLYFTCRGIEGVEESVVVASRQHPAAHVSLCDLMRSPVVSLGRNGIHYTHNYYYK